ncbi:MAG TPA: DNA-formamidopyrimidine glycosylase family protein [Longimicrobiales bacterium]
MPEGDNILRYANVLGRELSGRTVDRLWLHDLGAVPEVVGSAVQKIEARGKQMLVHLDKGWTLRVHLGMHGAWRRRHVRERAPRDLTVDLASGETAYACVRSYRAELIRSDRVATHPRIGRLGPDLLAEPPDVDEAVRRARKQGFAMREIGDLVMDQRVAAGIGNIYKSETLFETKTHPRTLMHQMDEPAVRRVFETAAELMRMNLLIRGRGAVRPRRRDGVAARARFLVYMRKNKPCYDCGTPIERILQGDMGRSTYFCPRCQALPTGSALPAVRHA